MEAHADLGTHAVRERAPSALAPGDWIILGVGSGLVGGLALAAPIVIWDWVRSSHVAVELPTAVTAWLFGPEHFSHTDSLAWPVVIGAAILAAYCALAGVAFTGLADRVYGVSRAVPSLLAGFAWGAVNFLFFWYMLLPIARGGDPIRTIAPNWAWILGFTLLGLATGACYGAVRTTARRSD